LGSGGIFGVGLGQSKQKFDFLPEVTTDSIFAIVAEELGLLGSLSLLLAYTFLVILGLRISFAASTPFAKGLSLALVSWLGLQAFINISALVAILPFTGIPLPFISYGGTSLVVNLVAAGLLINVGKRSGSYNRR
jgi:cell division protein FtsW